MIYRDARGGREDGRPLPQRRSKLPVSGAGV
jgi:hypothetical protein